MSEHWQDPENFSSELYRRLALINPGIADLELYEFRYCLTNITPKLGWSSIGLPSREAIEEQVNQRAYYDRIQIKPREGDRIVLDQNITRLSQQLFRGLVEGEYPADWVKRHFYFDIRGFFFLHRTEYYSEQVLAHFGGQPFRQFTPHMERFERCQDIGYQEFSAANADLDGCFIDCVKKVISHQGLPILLAIAGPTAAGKTEIVDRLRQSLGQDGQKTTAIELDNFLTDRDQREAKGIHSQGKAALHLGLLQASLEAITRGEAISIPRYDFVYATSSHDLDGSLKPGGSPLDIEPADIIFIEGNFPFLIEEVVDLIGIKVVYLTDDPIRLKRKWKRDIDYRKKYEPTYFRNRYFQSQFIMAEIAYRPQMEICDLLVDTTAGQLWVSPEFRGILESS